MRLEQALDQTAARCGERLALQLASGATLTYRELADRSVQFAAHLVSQGIKPGDRVALVSRHDLDAIALFFAAFRAGAIIVWLNDDARAADTPAIVARAEPCLAFVQQEKHAGLFQDTALAEHVQLLDTLQAPAPAAELPTDLDDTAPALLVFTSGSSGTPKGVCLSHRNVLTVNKAVVEHMPIHQADSYMMVVPLHYVHGIMQLTVHTLAGASIHFFDNFMFPKQVVAAIRSTEVTGFSGVPFHFNALITRGGLLEAELPHLRWMTVTGGKLAADTILKILDHFPELEFHIAYGQTECAPRATALHPSKTRSKPDSVGSPIPNVAVLLLDDAGNAVGQGEVGEVVVAGDNIMLGYWGDDEATRTAVDEQGRLHTGDLGRFDEDGDLFLVGRRSAMIKSAGERIVPEELERVLVQWPTITDAVVVGVADDMLGQRVVAHLQVPAHDEDDAALIKAVRKHMSERVALARLPREYHIWPEFPRKANGKPDRVALTNGNSTP